jgi:AraC family transcriptional regulator
MILTSMPDLPPLPATTANHSFRERFYARWGRENALVCGSTCSAEYETHPQTLSIKAAWGGGERYFLREREVVVDDDHWLILNQGRVYGSRLRAQRAITSFAVFFRPGLPAEVAAQRALPLAMALEREDAQASAPQFDEHLRAHGGTVSRRLRLMQAHAVAGETSEDWLEQQALLLMIELLDACGRPDWVATSRCARAELQRRLRLAADYIDTCHAQPIDLDDMARVACLSRYHFVRHFRALHGITPYAYLLRKRARVARRLLDHGATDRETVALQCGFANRFALARALARYPATGEQAVR